MRRPLVQYARDANQKRPEFLFEDDVVDSLEQVIVLILALFERNRTLADGARGVEAFLRPCR